MFTRQELIYLALGMRALAKHSREEARKATWHSTKDVFEGSARTYDELAAKCERLKDSAQ